MRNVNRLAMIVIVILAIAIIVIIALWPKKMAIEVGKQYEFRCFGSVKTVVGRGREQQDVVSYVLVILYPDRRTRKDSIMSAGVIRIPKDWVKFDSSLPVNFVVWDKPLRMDGKEYRIARMNPESVRPVTGELPRVREEIIFLK